MMKLLVLAVIFAHICFASCISIQKHRSLLFLRGGLVPQADEDGKNYFEQYDLDYGCNENVRNAGSLRGQIKEGALANLPQSDAFLKWFNGHLESGPTPMVDRVKAYYAADFGTKDDLKKGENPKIIIVNRKLEGDKDGVLQSPKSEVDVEVREIWQPWLKPKCNFVVRYIVPNRSNIIRIMEAKKQFTGQLEVCENKENGQKMAWAKMIFRPTLLQRLAGKKEVTLKYPIDAEKILPGNENISVNNK